MTQRLLVSFSGGETSAFMAKHILQSNRYGGWEKVFIFANTGQEHPETLEFVDWMDRTYDLNLVWVESEVIHGQRKSCGHRIVTFDTAARDGRLFEEMVKKYGIANKAYPHCTRSLKLDPINSYCRSIGWSAGTYITAVGLREDEVDRMSAKAKENRIIYPLISDIPTRKAKINAFWEKQPRRLNIAGYQGNCVWCWKKTKRKHFTLIEDDPGWYDLPARLEREYPTAGHNTDGTARTFFREGMSTVQLLEAAKQPFTRFHDENRVYELDLDTPEGCSESCEPFVFEGAGE